MLGYRKIGSTKKVLILLLIGFSSLVSCTQFSNRPQELLIVWGTQPQNDQCNLIVVNPSTGEKISKEFETCDLSLIEVDGVTHLASVNKKQDVIAIYSIHVDKGLKKEIEYSKNGMRFTSNPLSSADESLYVNGIQNGHEGIYHLPKGENHFVELLLKADGAPILSSLNIPGNRFFLYNHYANKNTRFQCRLDCYSSYYLYDTETGISTNLQDLVSQFSPHPYTHYTHCHDLWSPNNELLAFQIGCYSESPQQIAIINPITLEVMDIIKPIGEVPMTTAIGWISSTELIVNAGTLFNNTIISVNPKKTTEFKGLSLKRGDRAYEITQVDFNLTKSLFTGTVSGPEWNTDEKLQQKKPLVIGSIVNEEYVGESYLNDSFVLFPKISYSGDWIAFGSADDLESVFDKGVEVRILNISESTVSDNIGKLFNKQGLELRWVNVP